MSEAHQAPLIELEVDQEVFVDIVHDGDTIDDATVATEVTSFDRVGDAYVLEGAIVFAGYMRRTRSEDELSVEVDSDLVEHFHHRMPFWLRVPAKHQPRGIVNVASRIASWRLDVVSTGWVHVVADLQISGLNGQNGYHFQCGAQEEGDLFFQQPEVTEVIQEDIAPALRGEDVSADEEVVEDISFFSPHLTFSDEVSGFTKPADGTETEEAEGAEEAEEAVVLVRGSGEQDTGESDFDNAAVPSSLSPSMQRELDTISMARGGFDSELESGDENRLDDGQSEPVQALPAFDRAFEGGIAWDQPSEWTTAPVEESPQVDFHRQPVIAEFEVEHQLTPEQAVGDSYTSPLQAESFSPSRSFNDDGFRATAGFTQTSPTVTLSGRPAEPPEVEEVTEHVVDSPTDLDAQAVTEINAGLWSFVDFNGPEASHTLRFIVVMDDETLDSVADRAGCSKHELIRVNRLSLEEVRPGQSLMLPVR